jgi:lipooligosaccharide transport system permease protein
MMGAVRVVQRNALVYSRVWRGSVFSSFLQPTLFLIAMGLGIGTMIDEGGAALPGGVRYVDFLAPGLLAAAAMQTAGFESSWPVLDRFWWRRTYHAMTATPMDVADLVLGELAWIAVRLTTIAVAFISVMLVFGIPRSWHVILTIPAVLLTGLAFAAPILAFAASVNSGRGNVFNVLFRFVLTPLFLFSGVFFPIDRLPDVLERAAWFTPLFHGVELTRALTLGSVPAAWMVHAAFLAGLLAAGSAAAVWTFRRRLYA